MRTNPPVRRLRAVAIAPATDYEPESCGNFPHPRDRRIPTPRINHFERIQSGVAKVGEIRLREIRWRVCERSQTIRIVNELNCVFDGDEFLWPHLPRHRSDEPVERFRACSRVPTGHEQPRDVPAAQTDGRFFYKSHAILGNRQPAVCEKCHKVAESLPACRADGREYREELRVIGAQEVTQKVKLAAGKRGADFDSRHHFQAIEIAARASGIAASVS